MVSNPSFQCLRKGGLLYLLPDMDYGPSDSVFVPFFAGARCGHHPLARRALPAWAKPRSSPCTAGMTPQGYVAELTPAWDNFPTDDHMADTARMNRELQAAIRTMPPQYYLGTQTL